MTKSKMEMAYTVMSAMGGDDIDFLAKVFAKLAARAESEKHGFISALILAIGERAVTKGISPEDFQLALADAYVKDLIARLGAEGAAGEIEGLARYVRAEFVPKGEVN